MRDSTCHKDGKNGKKIWGNQTSFLEKRDTNLSEKAKSVRFRTF